MTSLPLKRGLDSVVHRFDIWWFTLSEITKHWLVGIGYGSRSYFLIYGQNEEVVLPGHAAVMHAGTHNIFLYLALHVGLPGMLFFGWFVVRVIREDFGRIPPGERLAVKSRTRGIHCQRGRVDATSPVRPNAGRCIGRAVLGAFGDGDFKLSVIQSGS